MNKFTKNRLPQGVVPRPVFMRALGLMPPYSEEDVKKAYRAKAARLHPDVGGDPEAFKALHRAYQQGLDYAQFHDSRRHWLGSRIEAYVAREQIVEAIRSLGGQCQFGSVDAHIKEFGRDFAEVLRELNAIELSGTHITDDTLGWTSSLGGVVTEVRTLTLRGTRISAEGLSKLTAASSLRALDLRETPVSLECMHVLREFPGLEWLHVGRTGLGYLSRRRLRKEFPRLKITAQASEMPPADSHWDEYLTVLRRLENL